MSWNSLSKSPPHPILSRWVMWPSSLLLCLCWCVAIFDNIFRLVLTLAAQVLGFCQCQGWPSLGPAWANLGTGKGQKLVLSGYLILLQIMTQIMILLRKKKSWPKKRKENERTSSKVHPPLATAITITAGQRNDRCLLKTAIPHNKSLMTQVSTLWHDILFFFTCLVITEWQ